MSDTKPFTGSRVYNDGLRLFSKRDWFENKLHNQDERPLEDGLTDSNLEKRLREGPIGALCYLRGDPEHSYRGHMKGESLGANIVVAYIIGWLATRKENRRDAVFRFINEYWQSLERQIMKARDPEDINKEGKQDWAQEKWTETQKLFDGLTVEVIKAAATFFQRAFLGQWSFESDEEEEEDSEAEDSEEEEDSEAEDSEEETRPLKRIKKGEK